jgi:xanthine dehydrogenase accessory factor
VTHTLVLIRGAGDLATGVAARLHRAGFPLVLTEVAQPTAIRRTVALAEAVLEGHARVEDLVAQRVEAPEDVLALHSQGVIPVLVDPTLRHLEALQPEVLVDATLAKRNLGIALTDAPLVIGVGPGFIAGQDVHAVVESQRGHFLGRVYWHGTATANTAIPGMIAGVGAERVVRAPASGIFFGERSIADHVEAGDRLGRVDQVPVLAPISGTLRGLLHDGLTVTTGMKIGDVDPRDVREHCWTISDKALSIGGGVLEAILSWLHRREPE